MTIFWNKLIDFTSFWEFVDLTRFFTVLNKFFFQVLALLYLDRLRSSNPKYLGNISSTDLFLVSLMVASKFLHDDGEEDEVFNDEWAKSGAMEKKELNELELNFLSAIDWSIYVSPNEYEQTTQKIELAVALKQVGDRGGWTTYSDLLVRQFSLNNFFFEIYKTLYHKVCIR